MNAVNDKTLVKTTLNNVKVLFSVDLGSSVNIMDEIRFKEIQSRSKSKIKLTKSKVRLHGYANETPITVVGQFHALLEVKNKYVEANFVVVKRKTESGPLLGCDTAMKLGVLKIVQNISENNMPEFVKEYDHLFHGIGKHKNIQVKLIVDENVKPVTQKSHRIPYHFRDKVKQEVKRLLDADVIEKVPADQHTTWLSPVVIVPKESGEIRLCIDMRYPNTAIKRIRYEIPTVDDIIHELNGATVFSKLDLNQAYHQFELEAKSRNLTTFSTHVGLYRFKRLNYGTVSAQEEFDHGIRQTLAGVSGCANISDDIIVYGKDTAEHNKNLKAVLKRLSDVHLTLNKKKCLFNQSSIKFFGYIFSKDGLKPDPAKVECLHKMPPPQNVNELRSFLGMANYSARFIQNFASLTAPLRELIKKGTKWEWSKTEQEAFEKVKESLSADTVMTYY